MVRFHPETHVSNSARPSSSPSSLRQNHQPSRPQRIGHRTTSANTRDLLHRAQSHIQPRQFQPLRSASSSSLSGLDYAAATSSPQRNHHHHHQYKYFNAQSVDPLTLRQFAKRELVVVLLWNLSSFAAFSFLLLPLQPHRILTALIPYCLSTIQRKTSVLPCWPARLAEYAMGRLSKQEVIASLSIHAAVFALSMLLVALAVPERFVAEAATVASAPQHDRHEPDRWGYIASLPWFLLRFLPNVIRESVSTAAFVMSLLVLPTVLDLNRFPPWTMVILYYPWGSGQLQHWLPIPATAFIAMLPHWASEATGAILAGELMDLYFPDDSPGKSEAIEKELRLVY